ncbi:Protein VTS1 [Choanephora cucurbitarum]|uniref:Protein VTS1 n=1 Tax=Choanephora cucurbitarum TaxID=101091 RepID=A0A1C7NNY5_9FUNG|nr:Protein VTS1 [Choanephora cucurbitarum]
MSAQSSFQRNSASELFSSLLSPEGFTPLSSGSTSASLNLSSDIQPDYANKSFSGFSQAPNNFRHQRPVSEIIKHESFITPEDEALNKWHEDLQEYESSLESMASTSLDSKYKEEVQHVDQWFRYLNEAERTATIYTLLQHSSQVQIRFFIAVLQQMSKKDPLAPLLSPAHPEKDMHAQLAGAMKKAELEASQKLLSVLPYQTGQVVARPNAGSIGRRNHIDRHSFAIGDTEGYNQLFAKTPDNYFLHSRNTLNLLDEPILPSDKNTYDFTSNRPKSVIENDLSSIFESNWPYNRQQNSLNNSSKPGSVGSNRPKSADFSNWSVGLTSSISSKSVRDKDHLLSSPWTGTPNSFGDTHKVESDQQSPLVNWSTNNSISDRHVNMGDDVKGFRRRTMNRTSIPNTVLETDEHGAKLAAGIALTSPSSSASIVFSMYDDLSHKELSNNDSSNYSTKPPYCSVQTPHSSYPPSRSTSPVPSQSNSSKSFNMNNPKLTSNYGQFLNPHDRINEPENGYLSDHSDASYRSNNGYRGNKKKGNNSSRSTNGSLYKEKKNTDVLDMQLLEDIPAWLRSLRLHKYNPIFESTKWQDMLRMDDDALLKRGVAALGARRKLLKVFDQIKTYCDENKISY